MIETMIVQGRRTEPEDVELVRQLIGENPSWSRTRLSQELCYIWDWRGESGHLKDMAARSFLSKLEQKGLVRLPPARRTGRGSRRSPAVCPLPHDTAPIATSLDCLRPITVEPAGNNRLELFRFLLSRYHYLGFDTVGKNLAYMAFDRYDRPLACLLFGSAAWKCAPRDEFIGWKPETREANINFITNNTRFLILPWVSVPHLASHVLGMVARRISADWKEKYGHRVHLLETFVETDRFRGTCYRAANWMHLGQTKGRSRQDTHNTMQVPKKDVWVYPLSKWFREALCG